MNTVTREKIAIVHIDSLMISSLYLEFIGYKMFQSKNNICLFNILRQISQWEEISSLEINEYKNFNFNPWVLNYLNNNKFDRIIIYNPYSICLNIANYMNYETINKLTSVNDYTQNHYLELITGDCFLKKKDQNLFNNIIFSNKLSCFIFGLINLTSPEYILRQGVDNNNFIFQENSTGIIKNKFLYSLQIVFQYILFGLKILIEILPGMWIFLWKLLPQKHNYKFLFLNYHISFNKLLLQLYLFGLIYMSIKFFFMINPKNDNEIKDKVQYYYYDNVVSPNFMICVIGIILPLFFSLILEMNLFYTLFNIVFLFLSTRIRNYFNLLTFFYLLCAPYIIHFPFFLL